MNVYEENQKLRNALEGLICWIGESPEGPAWATPESRARNRAMFDEAMVSALKCFEDLSVANN
jgi:hypothetical protein